MPCINQLPTTINSPVLSEEIFATLIAKFTEYGLESVADRILGALAAGRTREVISAKLIDVINDALAGEWQTLSCILKVPEAFTFDHDEDYHYTMGDDLAVDFHRQGVHWPRDIMPGTHAVGGYKLIYCILDTNAKKPVWFLWLLITIYELDWAIMALQTFDATEPIYKGENIIGYEAQVYFPINSVVLYALNDRPGLEKDYTWLCNYAGAADWVLP